MFHHQTNWVTSRFNSQRQFPGNIYIASLFIVRANFFSRVSMISIWPYLHERLRRFIGFAIPRLGARSNQSRDCLKKKREMHKIKCDNIISFSVNCCTRIRMKRSISWGEKYRNMKEQNTRLINKEILAELCQSFLSLIIANTARRILIWNTAIKYLRKCIIRAHTIIYRNIELST